MLITITNFFFPLFPFPFLFWGDFIIDAVKGVHITGTMAISQDRKAVL